MRELTATDSTEMSDRQTVYTFVRLDPGRISVDILYTLLQTNIKSQLSFSLNQKLQGVLGVGQWRSEKTASCSEAGGLASIFSFKCCVKYEKTHRPCSPEASHVRGELQLRCCFQ